MQGAEKRLSLQVRILERAEYSEQTVSMSYTNGSDINEYIKIVSRNVYRNLATKSLSLIQESHLWPEDVDAVKVPKGYYMLSKSRNHYSPAQRPGGGVVALIEDKIKVTLSKLTCPDIMVLDGERNFDARRYRYGAVGGHRFLWSPSRGRTDIWTRRVERGGT